MKDLFKKSAVAVAVASTLTLSGVVSADSLLVPLVASDDGTGGHAYETVLSFKIRGNGNASQGNFGNFAGDLGPVHYTWIQKGTTPAHMYQLNRACNIQDNYGRMSSWDMMFQDVSGLGGANANGHLNNGSPSGAFPLGSDGSAPAFLPAGGPFYGMLVIDDQQNITPAGTKGNDGDMSGFSYVIDLANGFVYSTKMLNNHKSTTSGDMASGFISKKSIDFAWMPVDIVNTKWLVSVTSDNMTNAGVSGIAGTGNSGSVYDATVAISQNTRPALGGAVQDSPRGPLGMSTGAYDHDERSVSGEANVNVTCMGIVGRGSGAGGLGATMFDNPNAPIGMTGILTPGQEANTRNGGWARRSVTPLVTAAYRYKASGAIAYKAEHGINAAMNVQSDVNDFNTTLAATAGAVSLTAGTGVLNAFNIETGGHLTVGANHANRPY